jgi:hypothetical protein
MANLHPLWRTLGPEGLVAGVEAQWHYWLGDTLDVVRPFLKPERTLASRYPCERSPGTCARRVVCRGDDDIVAVCGYGEAVCEPMPLTRADVVVYGLDLPRLLCKASTALGCAGKALPVAGNGTWSLGARSGGGLVFFVLPDRETGCTGPLAVLLAHYPDGDISVLMPTVEGLGAVDRALLNYRRVTVLACDEVFGVDASGEVTATEPSYAIPTDEVLAVRDGVGGFEYSPLAVCWRHEDNAPVEITSLDELEAVRALEPDVEHFVDATLDRPRCSKRSGGEKRDKADLTQGEVAMLLAFIARGVAGRGHERPDRFRISNLSTAESKKQVFKEMRRKVDRNTTSRQKYALFKARRSLLGGPQLYEIRPDEGVTFCFLVRSEDLAEMRAAAVR